jgi:MFS transporter, PAT family, beta-lactamase induction signal transducer AmpG
VRELRPARFRRGRRPRAYHPRVPRSGRLGKLGILWTLYFVQGLPFGFQATALPVYLRSEGMSLPASGSPPRCRCRGRSRSSGRRSSTASVAGGSGARRSWILPLQMLLAATCAAAALVPPHEGLTPILVLVLLMNLLAATLDIAVDGLAVDVLELAELGQGNVAQVVGYKVGMLTGGGLLVWASGTIGWEGLFLAMAALVGACFLVTLSWRESDQARRRESASPLVHPRFGEIFAALRRVATAPAPAGCCSSSAPTSSANRWPTRCSSRSSSTPATAASRSASGSAPGECSSRSPARSPADCWRGGGRCCARWRSPPRCGRSGGGEWWLSLVEPTPHRVLAVTCVEHLFGGALTTALFAYMMSRVDRRIGATHYTLLAALEVWGKLPAAWASGFIAANASYPFLFGLATMLSIAFLALLRPLRAAGRRARG